MYKLDDVSYDFSCAQKVKIWILFIHVLKKNPLDVSLELKHEYGINTWVNTCK